MGRGWDSLMVRLAYRGSGWSDDGEQAAVAALLPALPRSRVLDVGVGAGRTTSFLAEAAASYIGVDLAARMVADARRRFPSADLRVADARDLSAFADGAFDLVVFSLNGVDCLSHEEREAFLRDCARLLAPGGALLFSTHNLDGPSFAEVPSLRDARERLAKPGTAAKVEAVLALVPRLLLAYRNAHAYTAPRPAGDGWAVVPLRAHEFRFVAHFARLPEVRGSIARAGLELETAWSRSGAAIPETASSYDEPYAHFLCRRLSS
ncbi:MAG: SAM-dependent methyltransferase [Frankiales bacterium]|nr:SAM-dependent methyltransferase [Frankiales bacterium]